MAFVACGSGGGVGDDDAQVDEDSGESPDVTMGPDAGNQKDASPQDSTTTFESGPSNDATLDVEFGDAIWTADSQGGGNDAANDTGTGCSPDEILCNGNVAEICKNGNLSTQTCTNGQVCADGYGCVTCVPGSGTCNGSTASLCNSLGTGYTTSTCDSQLGLSCQAGVCVGDCSNIGQSYIGCDYYSVTMLSNWLDQSTFSFAVSVANTTTKSATVTITGPHTVTGNPFTVNAGSVASIVLPWEAPISCGTGPCNVPGGQPLAPTTAITTGGAYHIKSTEPITVYQFNPRDYQVGGSFSYSNDASLLIPVNALTGNYYVATYPSFYTLPGLIDIVGTQANTSVTVSPSVNIVAGGGLTATGGTVTLNAGDVLQITNPTPGTATYGTDMSGSLVSATAPVEVFGGQACVYIPAAAAYCDHIEEVMFPTETLGSDYLVVPPNVTGITSGRKPSNFIRIVGTKASTTLTYAPAPNVISGTASTTVGAGGVVVFETDTPIRVTSTNPVIVSMYMEGSTTYSATNYVQTGDPSQTVAVPTAQFRNSYPFTAPSTYNINWATVVAPTGNSVTIDSTTIPASSFTAIGTSNYGYYHYKICDNGGSPTCTSSSSNHTASSAGVFGIQVYGYGSYTSYWYPGGLNLTR
ncbi:MAG TPA: IgGFc-binding protein [Polyangiaceae bacterium]|nr:IgGFc-binding protein [Polyangiaceae bacterium]